GDTSGAVAHAVSAAQAVAASIVFSMAPPLNPQSNQILPQAYNESMPLVLETRHFTVTAPERPHVSRRDGGPLILNPRLPPHYPPPPPRGRPHATRSRAGSRAGQADDGRGRSHEDRPDAPGNRHRPHQLPGQRQLAARAARPPLRAGARLDDPEMGPAAVLPS